MARIAVGGFQHETNTFAPSPATYKSFEQGGGWPGVQYGPPLLDAIAGANLPAEGFIQAARAAGHTIVPLAWAAASPSDKVTSDAFERIMEGMLEQLRPAMPVDALYLDLHGAMVADDYDDGEGEILRRVHLALRERGWPRVPVIVSLDLHSNTTRAMFEQADALIAYRTYPHIDMADTGARAYHALARTLATGKPLAKAMRTFDFLTSINSQCSFIEPCKGIYELLGELEVRHNVQLSFTPGFPMADIAECGMAVMGYGEDDRAVAQALDILYRRIVEAEKDFQLELYDPDEAVARAMSRGAVGLPVVVADTQDNPGAGGNGDTTGLLKAMIRRRATDAVLGLLIDSAAAQKAHEVGRGNSAVFALGGLSNIPHDSPYTGEFTVEQLGDGKFTCNGPMFKGFRMTLGAMACLRSKEAPGVTVVLASRKCQAGDQDMFRHVGVEPRAHKMVALKSSVHFRADFQPIAKEVIVAKAPGPALADPREFDWKKLRRGVKLTPMGERF